MSQAKASLNNYRHSPRKVRLVADVVRGKKIDVALNSLRLLDKKASIPLKHLIESAVSNAKNLNMEKENLFVKEIRVDGGKILYRRRPASRGRALPIRKRTSHVSVVLGERVQAVKKQQAEKKTKTKEKETAGNPSSEK